MKKTLYTYLVLLLSCLYFSSCLSSQAKKNLSPPHKEFYSNVRYIITKKEKKAFLAMPASERDGFVEEFWTKRDPDPETEENEFKDRYFGRIEESNHLFKEGATPGWLQDRGRIYILIGPPENRDKFPMGYNFYDRPMEIWYYGFFPIFFVDHSFTGNYELEPISGQYIAHLLKAQMDLKPDVELEGVIFDFDIKLEKFSGNKIKVLINVPFEKIWLTEKEDGLETTLKLKIDVISGAKEKGWDFKKDYRIFIGEKEVLETLRKKYPITVETSLASGKYQMTLLLENTADGKKAEKTITFNLD